MPNTGRGTDALRLTPYQEQTHAALLIRWLRTPHVVRWWGDCDINRFKDCTIRIIEADGHPIGLVCWHTLTRKELDTAGLTQVPEGGADLDILIGEEHWLGRGAGPAALALGCALCEAAGAPFCTVCTSLDNLRAMRAYAKAGFLQGPVFDEHGYGPHVMMIRQRRTS